MSHYDSILKEEKKYQEVEPLIKNKKLAKYILIDFIVVLLVLIISYLFLFASSSSRDMILPILSSNIFQSV